MRPKLKRLLSILIFQAASEGDDQKRTCWRMPSQPIEDLEAIHPRHFYVQKQYRREREQSTIRELSRSA